MKNKWAIAVLLCLTLGLAPWWLNGEPHIIRKVKWLLGGGEGMMPMDWFDLLLHGSPWLFLMFKIVRSFMLKIKEERTSS